MATYKKQLQDKDGNTIYPDVGIDLDNVVYGDDPTTPGTITPWINTDDIVDGAVDEDKLSDHCVNATKIDVPDVIDLFYPIGSYYETSDTSFDPNTSWGGVWELDSQGKVTVSQDSSTFSTVGGTGGEESHTLLSSELPTHTHTYTKPASSTQGHTLTTTQIPGHSHKASMIGIWSGTGTTTGSYGDFAGTTYWNHISTSNGVIFESYGPGTLTTQNNTGGGGSHSHSISNTDNTATGNGGFANNAMNNLQPYVVVKRWHRTA